MAKKTDRAGIYYRVSTTDQNLNGQISELPSYAESEPVNAAYRGAWARPGRPVVPLSHWLEGVYTTRTASPISARACARFVTTVDLPTPTFWFAIGTA